MTMKAAVGLAILLFTVSVVGGMQRQSVNIQ